MTTHLKLKSIIILALFVLQLISSELLTNNCDADKACSPSWCTAVTNAACVDPQAGVVIADSEIVRQVEKGGCKTCTQSTDAKCTNEFLSSTLKTSGGLLVAYCNDKYLVMHTNGQPNHPDGLADIPKPPGGGGAGGYASQCVTRSMHQQYAVNKIPIVPVALSTTTTQNNASAFVGQTDPAAMTAYPGLPVYCPFTAIETGPDTGNPG